MGRQLIWVQGTGIIMSQDRKKLDLVTVFHSGDAELLKLQGLSINTFFTHDDIGTITLIANESSAYLDTLDRTALTAFYGDLQDRVVFVSRADLGLDAAIKWGWKSQQALKLLSHRCASSERCLILDTKNHFVRDCGVSDFFDSTNTPRLYYRKKFGQQQTWIRNSFQYFDAPAPADPDEKHLPTITPYPVKTKVLSAICEMIAKQSGSVAKLFNDPGFEGTEFYLVYSYLHTLEGGLKKNARPDGVMPLTLFAGWPHEDRDIDRIIADVAKGKCLSFALHKNRKVAISAQQWRDIQTMWDGLGLTIPSVIDFYEASGSVKT